MQHIKAFLGIAAAVLTIVVAVVAPLVWFSAFNRAAAKTSLKVDPIYTGGEPARTLERAGYQIVVYKPVPRRAPLAESGAFVQLVWKPAAALPPHVAEQIDIDGDGNLDLAVSFDVPRDPAAGLGLRVAALNPRWRSLNGVSKSSFSELIARVNDTILVRVPER